MAIAINSNFERDQYVAFAGQTVFAYSFPIFSQTYISVFKYAAGDIPDDRIQKLTLGTDYSVQDVGQAEGGTITLTVPAALGDIITVMGTEPIERESVFQDLNPFTVALNQQLNEQTVMQQQTYTYWNHFTPRYNADELVSNEVRPQKRILPMLPDGHVWVGRGSLGTDPDDIVTEPYTSGGGGGGNVSADHPGMRPSIAQWTGTDFVLTDSDLFITGAIIGRTAGATLDRTGFADVWGSMHWPAHVTGGRPAAPADGDTYYDLTLNAFYGYKNGSWQEFAMGQGAGGNVITVTQANTFIVGDWVRLDVGTGLYTYANNANDVNAEVLGMVETIVTPNLVFTIRQSGFTTGVTQYGALIPGRVYFLSGTNGKMALAETNVVGEVSLPVFVATTVSGGEVLNKRGLVISQGAPINVGDGLIRKTIHQVGHGLNLNDYVRLSGDTTYVRAQANTLANAQGLGFVVQVIGPDDFVLQVDGYVGPGVFTGLTPAGVYYLSETTPGDITLVAPTVAGQATKPVFIAESAITGWVLPQRPLTNPNNTNTTVLVVPQGGHGFIAGDIVKVTAVAGVYAKAQSTNMANAYLTAGMVTYVIDANNFVLQQSGYVTFDVSQPPTPAIVAGTAYFLSAATPGLMTSTEPSSPFPSRPVFQATGPMNGWITPQRPIINGAISNSPVTTVVQVGHGFIASDWVKITPVTNTYAKAQATDLTNSYLTAGMVVFVVDANTFILQQSGYVVFDPGQPPAPALTVGANYFLSPTVPGKQQTAEPLSPLPSRPTFQATAALEGWILPQKPTIVGGGGGGGSGISQVIFNSLRTKQVFAVPTSSWAVTPLSATITPSSLTSRIRIIVTATVAATTAALGTAGWGFGRNGVVIPDCLCTSVLAGRFMARIDDAGVPFMFVDSPNSTSPITYSLMIFSTPGGSITFNGNNSNPVVGYISTITLEEIL